MEYESSVIKNSLQQYFNSVKGEVIEINVGEKFSNVTLKVGKENTRLVNLTGKTILVESMLKNIKIEDKILAKFYISSNKKNNRYYTNATILEIIKLT